MTFRKKSRGQAFGISRSSTQRSIPQHSLFVGGAFLAAAAPFARSGSSGQFFFFFK